MRAVDTNVIVRLIARDDDVQLASAESYIANGAWVPLIVLAETAWVLSSKYGLPPATQADVIELMLNHRTLVIDQRELVESALALFRTKPTLGFADCLIVESARKAGHLPLGTFDRKLATVEGAQRL